MLLPYGLLGNGSQANETQDFGSPDPVLFRAVSSDFLDDASGDLVDIADPGAERIDVPVIAAVGAPGLRRELIGLWGGRNYRTLVSATSWVSDSAVLGAGTVVAPQAAVSTGAVLGAHVLLNLAGTVSHDTWVGDYATLSPGVSVAGNCRIGEGVFIGIGASVSNGVSIVAGAVIGAGSVVLTDITTPGIYVGAPARKIRDQEAWLHVL